MYSLKETFEELNRGIEKMLELMKEMGPTVYPSTRRSWWENRGRDADPIWRVSMRYQRRKRNGPFWNSL